MEREGGKGREETARSECLRQREGVESTNVLPFFRYDILFLFLFSVTYLSVIVIIYRNLIHQLHLPSKLSSKKPFSSILYITFQSLSLFHFFSVFFFFFFLASIFPSVSFFFLSFFPSVVPPHSFRDVRRPKIERKAFRRCNYLRGYRCGTIHKETESKRKRGV